MNLRATARAPRPNIRERQWAASESSSEVAIVGESPIYYEGNDYNATLYDRDQLSPGHVVTGPAIVMEMDSTTVVLPGYHATVDGVGNLLIEPANQSGKE